MKLVIGDIFVIGFCVLAAAATLSYAAESHWLKAGYWTGVTTLNVFLFFMTAGRSM